MKILIFINKYQNFSLRLYNPKLIVHKLKLN